MNPTEIEFAVRDLVSEPYDSESFPFDLIAIYNAPKSTVTKLRSGQTNSAKQPGDVLWKKHLFFRAINSGDDVASAADAILEDPLTTKHKPRFVLVTDGVLVHIRDLKLDDTCNVDFERLDENSDFLLPLAGFERRAGVEEHPADIKAAKRLKKLYDAILIANPTWTSTTHTHELNVFMTRVLFCLYAEDTGIFDTPKLFRNTVTQHTQEDGSNVAPFLDRIFRIMNVEESKRPRDTLSVELKFPYVNGSLFENTLEVPQFNRTLRRLLLECAELDWTTINPDIFGSMIQTIALPGARGDLGMHYTSVPNIMKVLQPLFLDDLRDAYEKAKDSVPKLETLLGRLAEIRVFDPACGSGNFLIIAYKKLRELEMQVLGRIAELAPQTPLQLSGISLKHFYGIDLVDFACETAKLSLWIAEHQTNTAFKDLFGTARPTLPLEKITTIHNGNALRLDWDAICTKGGAAEIYICGNPPYIGYQSRTPDQMEDIAHAIGRYTTQFRSMDYISAWFILASAYAQGTDTRYAFVSTNSICQGEQVAMLWPVLFSLGVNIVFAYTSFKWANSASFNAGVTCIIVGMSATKPSTAMLVNGDHQRAVTAIGPYLVPDPGRMIVVPRRQPMDRELPLMQLGHNPSDGGHLLLSPEERASLVSQSPEAARLVRRYVGSNDFINGLERYCLWMRDDDLDLAMSIPQVRRRIDAVREMRKASSSQQIRDIASKAHRFRSASSPEASALIIPLVFSERRQFLTVGIVGSDTIVSNTAYAIYNPPAYLIALLSSTMHLIWNKTVGGQLETRQRYSNTLIYNTFPIPNVSDQQKRILSENSKAILRARARHPGKTIAELYNPDTMPDDLSEAHEANDVYIEEYIYGRKFKDDTQRLEHLFLMYARMQHAPDRDGALFAHNTTKVLN